MSFSNQVLNLAYQAGYRVVDGSIISPKGKHLKGRLSTTGYLEFSYRLPVSFKQGIRLTKPVKVHRLVALQKYGDIVFDDSIVVRHKDGNPLNNLEDNILIGNHSDNMMDKPKEVRVRLSMNATVKNRVLTDEEVLNLKTDRFVHGLTYQQLADKYHICDKGHAHYIANHQYVTQK